MGERLVIRGGRSLRGRLEASGSKNAALYTLAAALLTPEPVILHNVPQIADIGDMVAVLRALGVRAEIDGTDVTLHAETITETFAPDDLVAAIRASFLVMGPLLARCGEAGCPSPGGDVIGARPVDVHLAGFRALGATTTHEGQSHVARASQLTGARIFLDYPSVLGTVNVLFAATLARGTTVIVNAAAEPEVAMLAELLIAMGARIAGHGTAVLTIDGVERLHGAEFSVIPDRIEAGTYLLAGVATGGDVEIAGAVPHHMDSLIAKLREAGADVTVSASGVRAAAPRPLAAVQLQAVPYPGFATDLHAPMAAALTQARGVSIIHERVFDNRLLYVGELRKLGARITTGGNVVLIEGPSPLTGGSVRALDVRAGAAVVLAALAADGETIVHELQHLDRGYPLLDARLCALGGDVTRS